MGLVTRVLMLEMDIRDKRDERLDISEPCVPFVPDVLIEHEHELDDGCLCTGLGNSCYNGAHEEEGIPWILFRS